jgi:hypothetical protein
MSARLFLLLSPFILHANFCYSQKASHVKKDTLKAYTAIPPPEVFDMGVIVGFNQSRYTRYFELGYAVAMGRRNPNRSSTGVLRNFTAVSASIEYNPFNQFGGFSTSVWKGWNNLFVAGLNANGYRKLNTQYTTQFGFRPFLGIGAEGGSLSYGYNFYINPFVPTATRARHNISLRIFTCMKTQIRK